MSDQRIRKLTFLIGLLGLCALVGCATHKPGSVTFLGIPETETSHQGPVGLIHGQPSQVKNVTAVSETSYQHYLSAKQAGRIFAEETHGDYVYYAIKQQRDVRFDNASAWVEVLERFKAKKP